MSFRLRAHRSAVPLATGLASLLPLLAGGCGGAAPSSDGGDERPGTGRATGPVWFEEVAGDSGVDFVYASGASETYRFPEIMGGGAALFDYDGDGDLDLYLVQSGSLVEPDTRPTNRLFRNEGAGQFVDVTSEAGVGHTGYGMGACTGDMDNDGDLDLYVTNVGPNVLFRNEGDGTFVDVTAEAGVGNDGWGTSCAFVDLDGDTRLDLYVVNNLGWSETIEIDCFNYYQQKDYCSPNNYNAASPDVLYHGQGEKFRDVSRESGISGAYGNGLGIACADYDQDGRVDVYIANDAQPNQLWHNLGDMKFENVAIEAGCAVNGDGRAEAGMGVQFLDAENDGDLDLFMTHLRDESNTLYVNKSGFFADETRRTGMLGRSIKFTGFGMGFADFDHDGVRDLFVANGAVQAWKQALEGAHDRYGEPDLLFQGLGDAKFEEIPGAGLSAPTVETSRGTAFGDIDDDGDVDLVVVDRDARVRILRNVVGDGSRAARFRVLQHGKDAIGALLRIRVGERSLTRQVETAYSYLASNDPRVHVGLGDAAQVDEVHVTWPGGTHETFGPLAAGELHVLTAGEGTPAEAR